MQGISLFGGSFTTHTVCQKNEATFKMVEENKNGVFLQPSEKTKSFFAKMLKERDLDTVSIKLVAGVLVGTFEDYAAFSFDNGSYGITMPRAAMTKLNELLEKDVLTKEEQQEFYEIEFFLGHEMHHIKRAVVKCKSSILHTTYTQLFVRSCISVASWALLRKAGVEAWWKALAGVMCVSTATENAVKVFRSSEESVCDLNASTNPEVLKAGAKAIKEHLKDDTEKAAKGCCFGLVWKYSQETAYVLGTHHPSPEKRSKALLKKAQELEVKHYYVAAGA